MNELGADEVGDGVVDRRAEENDVLFQQSAVEVIDALTTTGLFGDVRNVVVLEVHEDASES